MKHRNPSRPAAGMAALAAEVERRGVAAVRRDCVKAMRSAWPARHSSYSAPRVLRANVATLRDLELLAPRA